MHLQITNHSPDSVKVDFQVDGVTYVPAGGEVDQSQARPFDTLVIAPWQSADVPLPLAMISVKKVGTHTADSESTGQA
jgi:hypothetical protein